MLIDSHCHLTDSQFGSDLAEALRRARSVGVERILTVASHLQDARKVVELIQTHDGEGLPMLWGTAGIHPHEAEEAGEGDLDGIGELARGEARIVALGETGLDFFYDHSPREAQEAFFRAHLALAEELDLPVVVHSRSADELMASILREWGGRVQGVLHCFTGGEALMRTALSAGWMLSFTGMVTFKNYRDQDLLRRIPQDRLMAETDAPYLAPVPYRGHRNEPAYVSEVVQTLAEIRGEDLAAVVGYTSENAIRFFHLNP